MKSRVRVVLKPLLRAIISLGLLLWLFQRVNVQEVFSSFGTIAPGTWMAALGLYLVSQVLSSIRWYILARALDFGGRFFTYLKFYFVGMFFNLFLPSAIGGDVLKVFFLSRDGNNRLKATYSIFSDRLFGLWGMFALGTIAVILSPDVLPGRFNAILILSTAAMTLAVVFMPLFHRLVRLVFPMFSRRITAVLSYWRQPSSLVAAFLFSAALQFCGMYAVYLLGRGLGLTCSPEFYFAAFPLVAILTILPISLSGLGIREGGFVYFLGLKQVPPEKAITLSLGFFAVQVAAALVGGAGYLAGIHKDTIKDA